ncbi:SANT domain-containing protein [Phanerochaete sordida]|uniref:SANT domain-containing protein n=1 Tax=Phanerochaete sordida TaxID=48140 RepID=A0A9P3LJW9_9APHY|nr:SANT domain-containing protein [Phanerochaete sordida]
MYRHDDAAQPRDRRAWTEDEDELLRQAIEKEDGDANPPSKWHAIAKHIPNRTNKDCRKRWWAQMATRVSKGSWSAEEDERLFAAVDELGTKWAAVASRVGTRNSGQCAKRWNDALNPAIDRSGWTPEEDDRLLKAVEQQGHSWANIARTYLPGRTGLAAKNRYNHLIRGSSDRAPSARGRRMSAATAMRRRSTRGSSRSSVSTPSSPRSTATPPPASGASSPESSGMPPTPTELYALHAPLDFRTKWGGALPDGLYEDPALAAHHHQHAPQHAHHAHPQNEHEMMNMLLQNSFGDFLDPNMDPALSGLHAPYGLEGAQCAPGVMLSDSAQGDPWGALGYPYLDLGALDAHAAPPQLTPSMSSSGESSVNSTPQLGHPHFGVRGSYAQAQHPEHGAGFAQYMPPPPPLDDPRLALAMCDPYAQGPLSHLMGHAPGVPQ